MTRTLAASKDPRGRAFARRLALVQAVCERLEAGESLSSICRDPLMPQRYQLDRWRAAEPLFAEMVEDARAQAEAAGLWTRKANHPWSEELAGEILARIAAGRSLVEVCAEADMPHHTTVTRWLQERPAFLARYLEARQAQADALFDLAWKIARDATEEDVRVARLKIDTIKWRAAKLAPKRYGAALAVRAAERDADRAAEGELPEVWVRHYACGDDPHDVDFSIRSWPERTPDEPLLLLYEDSEAPEPPRHPSHVPPPAFRAPWEVERYGPGPFGVRRPVGNAGSGASLGQKQTEPPP